MIRKGDDVVVIKNIYSSICGTDVRDVMAIMASRKWDLESIITQEFPLEEISKAIQTAADPGRAFNVTIRF